MYVPTSLITRQGMLPVIPLREDQVATCFDEMGSFKSVRDLFHLYDKQTAPMEKTQNRLFKDWPRAALVSGNDDNSRSQLEIAPTIPANFTLDQSTTIYSDIGEAFHKGDGDNIFGKLHSHQLSTLLDHQQKKTMWAQMTAVCINHHQRLYHLEVIQTRRQHLHQHLHQQRYRQQPTRHKHRQQRQHW
jgi:hypothetical protein